MPLAFDGTLLIVVVTLLEMSLCVAFTAGHGTNGQHEPTLALFEIRDQLVRGHSWYTDESQDCQTPVQVIQNISHCGLSCGLESVRRKSELCDASDACANAREYKTIQKYWSARIMACPNLCSEYDQHPHEGLSVGRQPTPCGSHAGRWARILRYQLK